MLTIFIAGVFDACGQEESTLIMQSRPFRRSRRLRKRCCSRIWVDKGEFRATLSLD